MTPVERLLLRVDAVVNEAPGIRSFDLVEPTYGELPAFTAGAHLAVFIDDGLMRQYSLCNDPAERHRYQIAVLDQPDGRGGSRAMHSRVKRGDLLSVSTPRNHFKLAGREARFHLLLAGGIGVTPMMAMIDELERIGRPFLMHYCARSPESTAFLARLRARIEAGTVVMHYDGGDPRQGLRIADVLAEYRPGMHVYACGPSGFMAAVNASVAAWPPHAVHQEYFAARELTPEESAWDARSFQVRLARSGVTLEVPAGRSIVGVLRDHGIEVQTECEQGHCGTCITRYLEGAPLHRDAVLDAASRQDYVMICCARAQSDVLVLDI